MRLGQLWALFVCISALWLWWCLCMHIRGISTIWMNTLNTEVKWRVCNILHVLYLHVHICSYYRCRDYNVCIRKEMKLLSLHWCSYSSPWEVCAAVGSSLLPAKRLNIDPGSDITLSSVYQKGVFSPLMDHIDSITHLLHLLFFFLLFIYAPPQYVIHPSPKSPKVIIRKWHLSEPQIFLISSIFW